MAAGAAAKQNNLLCVLSAVGGDNLGCVAPPQARLTYGLESTRETTALAPPARHTDNIGTRATTRLHFHPLRVNRRFMTTHFLTFSPSERGTYSPKTSRRRR